MGLFRWFRRDPEPDSEWWVRLGRVESRMKQVEVDWEDTFDKMRNVLAKLGKRDKARREEEEEEEEAPTQNGRRYGNMSATEYGRRLTAARAKYGRS